MKDWNKTAMVGLEALSYCTLVLWEPGESSAMVTFREWIKEYY
jgi:hypothetical protein